MKNQNELALIVAYYLSRFDNKGCHKLGYKNFAEAFRGIGITLAVKPRTIQGMRDEFDPYHQNSRVGWVRELKGSRRAVFETFQYADDDTMTEIVKEILSNNRFNNSSDFQKIKLLLNGRKTAKQKNSPVYINRGKTGRIAESFYLEYFKKHKLPAEGKLIDCRELGCGYDFKIRSEGKTFYIEVKGMANTDGGVLFTNKEWQTALKQKNNYYLVVVKNISSLSEITIIQNPAFRLKANKNINTTVQINWSISEKYLNSIL